MAQTTLQMSFANAKVEMKIAAGAWTDISGEHTKIEVDGGETKSGEAFTNTGSTAILTSGKREKYTVKVNIVYTEGVSTPWKLLFDGWRAGSLIQFRWAPKGGTTGDYQYATATAGNVCKYVSLPVGEAGSADPVLCEAVLETPDITQATAA